jgi:hypothetical protein
MDETHTGAACGGWPNRSARETAAAVGTYIFEYLLDTIGAECAFIGAYACGGRIGWQIAVAKFTIGT